jgi:hypothetical protein
LISVCPNGSNYLSVDGRCYYIESNTQSSYETAEAGCVGKFPKGGRLFEPLTIEINDKVLNASRDVVSGSNNWFYIGVKRSATVGSDFKFVSSGVTVPYAIPWLSSAPSTSASTYQCVYANNTDLIWADGPCSLSMYAICESVGHDTDLSDIKVRA